jgi:ABC-type multidrug transport system ATPase subunit
VLFEILETGENAIFYATHILPEISRLTDELAFIDDGQIWLRMPKDDLLEQWRNISFQLSKNNIQYKAAVAHSQEGKNHLIISSHFQETLQQLKQLGAEKIQENRMSIDEIAVQILKGRKNVANS